VLDKSAYGKKEQKDSYYLVMALNFYGRMLHQSNPNRGEEADEYLKHSQEI
jgi:hypothetical protein